MPIEQRVIGASKIGAKNPTAGKIGARKEEPVEAAQAKGGSKKKLVLIVAAVVLVLGGGAAWYFLMGPGAGAAEVVAEPEPEPGDVLVVDPISVNLAGGHYLRIGYTLQFTLEASGGEHEPDPSKSVDLAIALYSGRTVEEVSDGATREALKGELLTQVEEAYHGEVMDLYLTNFVTQ